MLPNSKVEPSGSAFATCLAPSAPAAPARFSTITGWPSRRGSCWLTMRAATSTGPPGGNGTIILSGRAGRDCADAAAPSEMSRTAANANRLAIIAVGSRSIDLDVGRIGDRRPARRLAGDEVRKILRRADAGLGVQARKPALRLLRSQDVIHGEVELVD